MKLQTINIIIPFFGKDISEDFEMRYKLVDFIEDKGLGEVMEEGTGQGEMYVIVQTDMVKEIFNNQLSSVLGHVPHRLM